MISKRGLNTSLPWCVHPDSINVIFYDGTMVSLFAGDFELRCFQLLFLRA